MKVCFLHADKPIERVLAEAFLTGVKKHGDEAFARSNSKDEIYDCDIVCMVGVKSRTLFRKYAEAKTHIVYFDKGYSRHKVDESSLRVWEYWRVSVNSHHPTKYLAEAKHGSDRWDKLGFTVKPWRTIGNKVILAGSSQKYHDFYNLKEPTQYWQKIVKQLKFINPNFFLVYRPKSTWKAAVPIEGTVFTNHCTIEEELKDAWCLITHGSNACFEALLNGVPCIVLGNAIAKPISDTAITAINKVRVPTDEERQQLFNNLAYMQWTQTEMLSGEAWESIRPQIFG